MAKHSLKEDVSKAKHISADCQTVKNMDFTIKEPQMDVTENENQSYKETYLKVLKNEMLFNNGRRKTDGKQGKFFSYR